MESYDFLYFTLYHIITFMVFPIAITICLFNFYGMTTLMYKRPDIELYRQRYCTVFVSLMNHLSRQFEYVMFRTFLSKCIPYMTSYKLLTPFYSCANNYILLLQNFKIHYIHLIVLSNQNNSLLYLLNSCSLFRS